MTDRTLCLGEALVDVVLRDGAEPSEHVGGSLFNVACGLASLGDPTSILSWWGRDVRGHRIAETAARAALTGGITVLPVCDSEDRLVGIVPIDDAARIIAEADEADFALSGGTQPLYRRYLPTPIVHLARSRIVWRNAAGNGMSPAGVRRFALASRLRVSGRRGM